MTNIADLNVGDRLRLAGPGWSERRGRVVIVDSIDLDNQRAFVHPDPEDVDRNGDFHAAYVDNIEYCANLVETAEEQTTEVPENAPDVPEGLTFERYHESMFPMIETLSKAADEAGYCHEYDRMARSIGAPTRAEVRRIVQERDGRRYRVTIPVTVNIPVEVNAQNVDAARILAMNARLPGTPEDWNVFDSSTNSWRGLKAAMAHVISQVSNYPSHDELVYGGPSSFTVREI